MVDHGERDRIQKAKDEWEEKLLNPGLKRFGVTEPPNKFYCPLDMPEDWDFLREVGFPGAYPFTAGKYPFPVPGMGQVKGGGFNPSGGGLVRAGRYSGYGLAENTRDHFRAMLARGWRSGPNFAFDLPTQCGYDSDAPEARGEVGRTGVAVDTLEDFETIYEAFTGDMDLDKISSNFTINAPANVIIAMYAALAEKRGIPLEKLRGTPQNDILKEFVARGTYIFPPQPSLRLTRDSIVYISKFMPKMNAVSICMSHMSQAGAPMEKALAFTLCNGMTYLRLGVEAGLDIDEMITHFPFHLFSFDIDILRHIAGRRAMRRIWAKIMKERFKAKSPRSWMVKDTGSQMSFINATKQRPLNNLVRAVIAGVGIALASDIPVTEPPYDEALGLGWSLEGQQLSEDAARIIQYEAKLTNVIDPFAGSYYMEGLTSEVEAKVWEIIDKVEGMGGSVAAIENGYMQREIALGAYEFQKEVEACNRVVVGANSFLGSEEIDVKVARSVPHPYDPEQREMAEEKQIAKLARLRRERDNSKVASSLASLRETARDEKANTMFPILEAVKAYATVGEICNAMRDVFGECRLPTL
ncbi:methylmalonyl-CoA mutase family protein [Chloroflexota bacterium]